MWHSNDNRKWSETSAQHQIPLTWTIIVYTQTKGKKSGQRLIIKNVHTNTSRKRLQKSGQRDHKQGHRGGLWEMSVGTCRKGERLQPNVNGLQITEMCEVSRVHQIPLTWTIIVYTQTKGKKSGQKTYNKECPHKYI